MNIIKSIRTVPHAGRRKGNGPKKFLVLHGQGHNQTRNHARNGPAHWKITQLRLARIQELQSRLAFMQEELNQEWQSLRRDMLRGAKVETGPIRAFFKYSLRFVRSPRSEVREVRDYKILVVR